MSSVAGESLEARPAPYGTRVLLHQCEIAEFPARGTAGLILGQAAFLAEFRFFFEMELKLLAEFGFLVGPPGKPA